MNINILPVTFVFHPEWWHKNYGLTFEKDFFYNPRLRVEVDFRMRKILYERFGKFGVDKKPTGPCPCIGATYLAAGYIISEIFGCKTRYYEGAAPEVQPQKMSDDEADKIEPGNFSASVAFKQVSTLIDKLKERFGYVTGDINWQGVLNVALDIRGQEIFIDMAEHPQRAKRIFSSITETLIEFVNYIRGETGTSSISVNRAVEYVNPKINLHSNCSVMMVAPETYRNSILEHEIKLSRALQPYGIHHCGNNLHRHADGYARVPDVCFFDVGWGSDIIVCRKNFPEAFLNLRYDPVKMRTATPEEVERDVLRMVKEAGDPKKTGFCCVNMGWDVPDRNIAAIYSATDKYRNLSL